MRKLSLMASALVISIIALAAIASAQTIGTINADIPFNFTISNRTLPAGKYTIKSLNTSFQHVMMLHSADNNTTYCFFTQNTQLNKPIDRSELVFNRYGDHYFLSKILEQGDITGIELAKSSLEKRMGQEDLNERRAAFTPIWLSE